jgi:filamentous hemagglutinin family protein
MPESRLIANLILDKKNRKRYNNAYYSTDLFGGDYYVCPTGELDLILSAGMNLMQLLLLFWGWMMERLRKKIRIRCFRKVVIYFLTCCLILNTSLPVVLAEVKLQPGGVIRGDITVTPDTIISNKTNMTASDGAIGHFSDFDIGTGYFVDCVQPSADASALFRIFSGDGTQIHGRFDATGHIYLIDTAGILFGAGSEINVTRLVASGLNMSDPAFDDVLEGKQMIFSSGNGDVTNNGTITATDSVYLVGEDVINNGSILCPDGLVVMAAGDTLRLGQPGSSVIVDISTDLIANRCNDLWNNGTVGEAGSPVGKLVLAAGDVWSQAAIANVGDLVAIAKEDLTIDEDVTVTGDMTLIADTSPAPIALCVHALGTLVADGDIDIMANNITLEEAVDAGGNLTITGRAGYSEYSPAYESWGDVYAYSTLDAGGDIEISVTGEDQWGGYWPGSIYLDGDVTAGGNLVLYNNTYTSYDYDLEKGVTLQAGQDVILTNSFGEGNPPGFCDILTGETELTIIAGAGDGVNDGRIYAGNTTISVYEDTSLTLQQDLDIDLGDGQWTFSNQGETDLTLISNEGSVKATEDAFENAAGQWESVGAEAKGDIELTDWDGIRTRELLSHEGDITVDSWYGAIEAWEDITAEQGDVTLAAYGWIYGWADIYAGQNVNIKSPLILLGGEWVWDDTASGWRMDYLEQDWVFFEGGAWIWQGNQYITAENGILTAESWIGKYTPGELHMYAGWDSSDGHPAIDLLYPGSIEYYNPTVLTAGNLYMQSVGDVQIAGDITSRGWWRSEGEVHEAYPWAQLLFESDYEWGDPVMWPWAEGGVSIISEQGKIYTRPLLRALNIPTVNGDGYDTDIEDYELNVTIEGFSDDITYRADDPQFAESWYGDLIYECGPFVIWNAPLNEAAGVDLPYGPGKAAVVLVSAEDLKFGPESNTQAYGMYGFAERYSLDGIDNWDEFEAYEEFLRSQFEPFIADPFEGFYDYLVGLGYTEGDFESEESFGLYKSLREAYIAENPVLSYIDDRPGVAFLDVPEKIGGFDREPGLPIDVAVYAQSTEGDVVLAENADIAVVSVLPDDDDGPEYGFNLGATVVLDAYDTVSIEGLEEQMFGFEDLDEFRSFLNNLGLYYGYNIDLGGFANAGTQALIDLGYIENEFGFEEWATENFAIFKDFVTDFFLDYFKDFDFGDYFREYGFGLEGFRLEVCSRRTGTLGQAIAEGTLPFADSLWVKDWLLINDYVLRGEGNLDINRAWVLDNNLILKPEPTPKLVLGAMRPFVPAAPIPERLAFEISGYPALMNWVAKELGIDKGRIQIGMANSLASARDIQPYRTFERLKAAATVLQDVDGTRVAALAQVISQFASSTAPPTEEQMASIADAIANDIEGNSQYAAAGEYLDALAKYVSILTNEMGFSVDESIQIATNNYVQKLVEGENLGVAAYVAARLAALGGS